VSQVVYGRGYLDHENASIYSEAALRLLRLPLEQLIINIPISRAGV
jgi:hypothetical protein